ncbi:MAG: uroporphyrinogen-III C-methyltransferase [Gemmataceae bacterium]|nr:uroporphyrinogen-III C-methyltransferase [Gemmataceae bacterium]
MSLSDRVSPGLAPGEKPATVYFVGAGPGNPGLITVRGAQILSQAGLVIYDRLVSHQILELCPETVEKICAESLPGCHPERIPALTVLLMEKARAGINVVRLKGGDPLLFGRGAEEIEPLAAEGIPFEVVPGITAALGASAFAGILLTDRTLASAVAFVTGHEKPGKEDSLLDWGNLARFPGTLVFYMGIARVAYLTSNLIAKGMPPDTPCAVVSWATMGKQKVCRCSLEDLPPAVEKNQINPPAVIIVGKTAAAPSLLDWRQHLPLKGAAILLARPQGQNRESSEQLSSLGADVFSVPSMNIGPPKSWENVDQAILRLEAFDWIVFTSVNGVRRFFTRVLELGFDLRKMGSCKIAAIGPATAKALASYSLKADQVPATYSSEGLAESLAPHVQGKKILLVRAEQGRAVLKDALDPLANLTQVAVYCQQPPRRGDLEFLRSHLENGLIHYLLVTSSNIAKNLVDLAGESLLKAVEIGKTKVVSISPITSTALRELGVNPALEAKVFTMNGLIDQVIADWAKRVSS